MTDSVSPWRRQIAERNISTSGVTRALMDAYINSVLECAGQDNTDPAAVIDDVNDELDKAVNAARQCGELAASALRQPGRGR